MKERERNEVELDERLGKVPVSTLAGKGTRYFSGRVSKKKKKGNLFLGPTSSQFSSSLSCTVLSAWLCRKRFNNNSRLKRFSSLQAMNSSPSFLILLSTRWNSFRYSSSFCYFTSLGRASRKSALPPIHTLFGYLDFIWSFHTTFAGASTTMACRCSEKK